MCLFKKNEKNSQKHRGVNGVYDTKLNITFWLMVLVLVMNHSNQLHISFWKSSLYNLFLINKIL